MSRTRDTNPIRRRREQLGLTLTELSAQIPRVSTPLLSMIEGGYVPRVRSQQAIADALESTRETLFPAELA